MHPVKALGHQVGVVYFITMLLGIAREFAFPRFTVAGDAGTTANNITAAEGIYRAALVTDVISAAVFACVAALLYKLLRGAGSGQAMLMLLLVMLGIAASLAGTVVQFLPLVLLSGADYLSAFTKPQLDALTLGVLTAHRGATAVAVAFWGLWLFPFGILVIRSRIVPRILGIFLLVAGTAYVVYSAVSVALPEQREFFFRWLTPLFLGEVPIILWLLIKGARVLGRPATTLP